MCSPQGETGVVFYLTLDVVETNCSVLSKKDWKSCEIRPIHDTSVRNILLHSHRYHKCPEALCWILYLLLLVLTSFCRFMDSAKPPFSSISLRGWCVSTNTTVWSGQVKNKNYYGHRTRTLEYFLPFELQLLWVKAGASTLNSGPVSTVPADKVISICPDCPMYYGADDEQVKKTLTLSLEKFNKESGMNKRFALLKFNRALVSVSPQVPLHWQQQDTSTFRASRQTLLVNRVTNAGGFQVFLHLWVKGCDQNVAIHVFPVCLSRWAS